MIDIVVKNKRQSMCSLMLIIENLIRYVLTFLMIDIVVKNKRQSMCSLMLIIENLIHQSSTYL